MADEAVESPGREPDGVPDPAAEADHDARDAAGSASRRLPNALRPSAGRVRSFVDVAQRSGLLFALLALAAYFSISSDAFLQSANLKVILLQVAIVGILAVPGAMLILSGYVDLSVGSVAVLAAVCFGEFFAASMPLGIAVVLALAVGAAWGLLNGALIAYLSFSPIIVTLGGFAAARGLAELVNRGQTQFGFGSPFDFLGNGEILGLPTPAVLMLLVFAVGGYIWYQMPLGRHLVAIGADAAAAFANGVSVRRLPAAIYIASGVSAALGGLILASQLDGASLGIGEGLELQVLTAILLGGVSFTGGRGSLFGVLLGVLFVGVLRNGLILLNVGPFYADIAIGAALVAAAGLDVLYRRLERVPVLVDERAGGVEPAAARGDR